MAKPEERKMPGALTSKGGTGYRAPTPKPTYTPFTGGGDSRFITAPGDSTIEYGTGRTRPAQSLGNTEAPTVTQPTVSQERGPLNWRDSAFNAQIASIQRALEDFETGAQTRGERYGQDFSTGLSRLGYRPAEGFQAMPNILEQLNQPQAMARGLSAEGMEGGGAPAVAVPPVAGAFDIEGQFDPYSSAARGTRGLRDEFAGRGTLRSSDFAKTFGEFQNRLNQQLEAMETSRGRFGQDLATEVAQQRTQSQERQQAAQRDAMMRAAVAAAGGAGF
jgi:hypothetical protein